MVRPAPNRKTPSTVSKVSGIPKVIRVRDMLTIEHDNSVPDFTKTPRDGVVVAQQTSLLGFDLVDFEDAIQRCSYDGSDDGKGTKSPAPVDIVQEALGSFGPGECGDHIWRGSESESQTTISQVGNVTCKDADGVDDTAESDRIKDLDIDNQQIVRIFALRAFLLVPRRRLASFETLPSR